MIVPYVLCDVFTTQPFSGNPLAVFLDAAMVPDALMSSLAVEFGWSEVTFVTAGNPPRVRIWTPFGELPFAGHPTIGTTVVLASRDLLPIGASVLHLGIGEVEVEVRSSGSDGGSASMTQRPPQFGQVLSDRIALAAALGLTPDDLAPDLPAQMVSTGLSHFMVPLRSLDALQRATPLSSLTPLLTGIGARWAYCFTTETPNDTAAARSRLLSMDMEDAATGSAAGPLGAYLVYYGLHERGELEIEQGIEMGRPSRLAVDVPVLSGEIGPVRVSGEVRIWGRGEVTVAP